MIEYEGLRREVIEACLGMNASGLNQGTAGNVSVRNDEGFLITGSGIAYDSMGLEDVVQMDLQGSYLGPIVPSSEWRMHLDLFRSRPEAGAIVHVHSPHATALSCLRQDIPAFHYMVGVAGGTNIRCAEYATFGTQELSDAALKALEDRRACLLGQHGQITIGKTLDETLWLASEVETLARLYVQALPLGEPPVLSNEEMERVIDQMQRMSYGHGPEPDGSNDVARPRG